MECNRILYLGGAWPTNIGNAFIDLGSMRSLEMALPASQVSLMSELPRWLFWRKGRIEDALRLDALVDCDLFVVSGMTCCDEFLASHGQVLREARARGVPALFNGCGGWDYSAAETANFRKFLKEIDPVAFISRDSVTFQNMQGCCASVHDGIDCAFYLPEAHTPVRFIDRKYAVLNFDSMKEPRVDPGMPVFRSHHVIMDGLPKEHLAQPHTLVSDLPQDYLNLYANCSVVYSDRVHACIAALAYGRRAMLFSGTPRGHLFEKVGAAGIRERPVSLDPARLAELKAAQIELLRAALRPDRRPAPETGKGSAAAVPLRGRG